MKAAWFMDYLRFPSLEIRDEFREEPVILYGETLEVLLEDLLLGYS